MGRDALKEPTTDNQYDRLMKRIRADYVTGDDGYKVYWPDTFGTGAFSPWLLRLIADDLDKENDKWHQIVLDNC